jgi:hypothetical protein
MVVASSARSRQYLESDSGRIPKTLDPGAAREEATSTTLTAT